MRSISLLLLLGVCLHAGQLAAQVASGALGVFDGHSDIGSYWRKADAGENDLRFASLPSIS